MKFNYKVISRKWGKKTEEHGEFNPPKDIIGGEKWLNNIAFLFSLVILIAKKEKCRLENCRRRLPSPKEAKQVTISRVDRRQNSTVPWVLTSCVQAHTWHERAHCYIVRNFISKLSNAAIIKSYINLLNKLYFKTKVINTKTSQFLITIF